MVEDDFAHTHRLGSYLYQLVFLDVFKAFLKRHDGLRNDASLIVGTAGTNVGELLGLADIDDKVVVVNMF